MPMDQDAALATRPDDFVVTPADLERYDHHGRRLSQRERFARALDRLREAKEREEQAARLAAAVTHDYPRLPTSATNASPILPEEPGDGLTGAQRLALASLASGGTFSMAAHAAGVTRKTVYNWRSHPAFVRTLDGMSREALDVTGTRVRNLMLRATRVIAEELAGRDAFGGAMRVATARRLWEALRGAPQWPQDDAAAANGEEASAAGA